MKFKGQEITGLAKGKVTLMKESGPIDIQIQAIPLGTEGKPRELFPTPPVPTEIVMKKNGRAVQGNDGRIVKEPNYDDPDWITESAKAAILQTMYLIYQSLKDDPNLTFSVTLEDCKDEKEFYFKVYEEFQAAGFTMGDIRIIQKEILKVSNIDAEAVEDRIDDFLLGHPNQ